VGGVAIAQNNQGVMHGHSGMYPAFVHHAAGDEPDFIPSISDLTGRVITQREFSIEAGANNISLPVADFLRGIYFLHISGKQTARFQILR
jgi:hypothetical protein